MSTPLNVPLIDPETVTRDTDLRVASIVDEPWFAQARYDLVSLREAEIAPAAEIKHPEIFREVIEPQPLTGKEIRTICSCALVILLSILGLGFAVKTIGDDVHKRGTAMYNRSTWGTYSSYYTSNQYQAREAANVRMCESVRHPRKHGIKILRSSRLNSVDRVDRYRVLFKKANQLRVIDCRG